MKKTIIRIIAFALLLLNHFNLISQELQSEKIELTEKQFSNVIQNSFTKVATGVSSNSIGNFISIEPEKTDLNVSANFIFKNGNVINAKVSGGATDGIMSVFNNSKLNNNIAFEINYNFLFRDNKKSVTFRVDEFIDKKNKKDKIDQNYILEKAKIDLDIKKSELIEKNFELKKNIEKNESDIEALKNENTVEEKLKKAKINKIKFNIFQDSVNVKNNEILIQQLEADGNDAKELLRIGNDRAKEYDKNDVENIEIIGVKMSWITFGYKVRSDNFKLLDLSEDFANQIKKDNTVSHDFKIQYTSTNLNSFFDSSNYFSTSITYSNINNLEDLDKIEIDESSQLSTNGNQTRKTSKKIIVYDGSFEEGINQVKLSLDYFHFFKNNRFGFHLFPISKYLEKNKPQYNFGVGVIAPFKSNKNDNSIVNLELYYNSIDLFNSNESKYDLFERNDIGFRVTFPFNF